MHLEYLEHLNQEQQQSLRDQGVCLDDWDYLIIVKDINQFKEVEEKEEFYNSYTGMDELRVIKKIVPFKSYHLDRLIQGPCSYMNEWYKIVWEGEEAALGINYHA